MRRSSSVPAGQRLLNRYTRLQLSRVRSYEKQEHLIGGVLYRLVVWISEGSPGREYYAPFPYFTSFAEKTRVPPNTPVNSDTEDDDEDDEENQKPKKKPLAAAANSPGNSPQADNSSGNTAQAANSTDNSAQEANSSDNSLQEGNSSDNAPQDNNSSKDSSSPPADQPDQQGNSGEQSGESSGDKAGDDKPSEDKPSKDGSNNNNNDNNDKLSDKDSDSDSEDSDDKEAEQLVAESNSKADQAVTASEDNSENTALEAPSLSEARLPVIETPLIGTSLSDTHFAVRAPFLQTPYYIDESPFFDSPPDSPPDSPVTVIPAVEYSDSEYSQPIGPRQAEQEASQSIYPENEREAVLIFDPFETGTADSEAFVFHSEAPFITLTTPTPKESDSPGEIPLNQAAIEDIRSNIRNSALLSPARAQQRHQRRRAAAATYQHEYSASSASGARTLRIVNPDSEVEGSSSSNTQTNPSSPKSKKQIEDDNIKDIIGELNKVKSSSNSNSSSSSSSDSSSDSDSDSDSGSRSDRRTRRRNRRNANVNDDVDLNPTSVIDMSLFPSFIDNPGALGNPGNSSYGGGSSNGGSMNHPIPRQAPSPGHGGSQQMSTNGINGGLGGGAGGAGPSGMVGPNVNVLNAAGHQSDLNLLWGMVNELSSELQKNREATQEMIEKAQLVRERAATEGVDGILRAMNGELNGMDYAAMESSLSAARAEVSTLQAENNDLASLLADYESSLEKIMEMLRRFAHERTLATLAIHRQYSAELATERSINLGLRQEHAEWQGRLMGLSTLLREALRHQVDSEEESGAGVEFAALRAENRALRRLVGLPTEEDDEEGGEGEGEGRPVGREWDLGDGGQQQQQ
ncbi:MAG: hypothetical protein M1829_005086 [Trizodia sp. TS-e1964]|nr:MAG: hypothetical protein M1829_005086 [Trizodia sp. TS-e1964]